MTKTRHKNVRDQLLARLSDSGWERIEVDTETDWWADEHWTIRSVRQAHGLTLVLTFMVDPFYEQRQERGDIWHITASTQRPAARIDDPHQVAELPLQKGHVVKNVISFVEDIDRYRNGVDQKA